MPFSSLMRRNFGEYRRNDIDIVCHKSLLYLFFFFHLSFLESCPTIIRDDCHWLRAVSWQLSVRCPVCAGKAGLCIWHGTQGCRHEDCAHYVPLKTDGPYYCPFADQIIPEETFYEWLNVSVFFVSN